MLFCDFLCNFVTISHKVLPVSGRKDLITMRTIDDGFYPWLVEAADFDSVLDMPSMSFPKRIEIPGNLIPYSKVQYSEGCKEYVHFYEHDIVFRDFLRDPESHVEKL